MANYDLTYEGSEVQKILDTGDELQSAGYIFRGEATPSTVTGTPTERVAYIGGPGTYTNFGTSITVAAGCVCIFKYTGTGWSNQVIDTGLASAINSEATTRSGADTALQNAITAINNNIGNGYVYAGVATPSTSPVTGKVFYLAVTAGTYTNFGNIAVTAGLNVLKYNGSAWSKDQVIAIDDEPTQGSANLVKSGGVLNAIIQNGPAFDLSAYNAVGGALATYADLSAALTALNALPAAYKKGGMSLKFVLSSDNKYIQFRLIADAFTTDITKWLGDDILTEISDTYVDLEFKDENNNVLSQFYNGHVRTKNFDSAKSVTKDELDQEIDKLPSIEIGTNDLDIKDENGNVIAQFYDGNIKTKNFDSKKIVLKNTLKGKRVGILGDSISSYRGLIPSGYVGWYPTGDVTDSSQMWFGIVRDLLEVDITNCSWAGSKVCGNSGNTSAEAGCSTKRISDLAANGTPDVVICYIGINDFGDSNITMGEWNNTKEIPSEGTISNFANAYAIMVNKIMSTYPMAKVYCCTLLETRQNDVSNDKIPTINHHGEALEDWNDIIRKISKYFGAGIIDLHSCGINWYNIPTYAPEDAIHPWADGQKLIGNSVVKHLI